MKDRFLKATMGLGLMVFAADQVAAQNTNCAPRDVVTTRLTETYKESRQAIGLGSNNVVVEVFASESGSWTITATLPNGATCIIASGQAFETIFEPLPVKGDNV